MSADREHARVVDAGNGHAPGARSRKLPLIAGALALLLLLLALSLRVALQPERVTRLLLDRAGKALGLEIAASGVGEYRLRGTPTLVVRDLVAREPGAARPLLRAQRVLLAVPWSTIRSRGAVLDIDRIELDRPQLDLAAFQRWLDRRPERESRAPTLRKGLQVTDGSVIASSWRLEALDIALPSLHPRRRVDATLAGRYLSGNTRTPFDLQLVLAQPATDTALGLAGTLSIQRERWRIPATIRMSGLLHLGQGWRVDRARLRADARYQAGKTQVPFVLGLAGPLRYRAGRLSLIPAGVALRSVDTAPRRDSEASSVPTLDASGAIALATALELHLRGLLAAWPRAWPALPPPIGQSDSALPFVLDYVGKSDLSQIAALRLERDASRFDGRFRLPDVTGWVEASKTGSPIPPLDGRIGTPRLEIAGAQLEGVQIRIDDPDVPEL